MRLDSFFASNRTRVGAELKSRLIDLNAAHAARLGKKSAVLAPSMLEFEFVRMGKGGLANARRALTFVAREPSRARRFTYDFGEVKLLAPIPRPRNFFCSDLNYRSHVEEDPTAVFLEDPGSS